MIYFYRLIVASLLLFSASAWAAVPLTPASTQYWLKVYNKESGWKDSLAEACSGVVGASKIEDYLGYTVMSAVPFGTQQCSLEINTRAPNVNETSTEKKTVEIRLGPAACPANSTLSGSSCICNSGFKEKEGQCVKPDKCSELATWCSSAKGSQRSYSTYDGDSETSCYQPPDDLFWDQPKYPGCSQGCMAKAGPSTGVTDSTGKTLYKGIGTLTGGLCTYGTPTEPTAPDAPPPAQETKPIDKRCAGQTGTVNGDTVCIPASSATGVDWTGSTTNSDGSKTEGKTTTTCSNGVCESTTVKTNKDANGNVTGTTTTTDKVSQDQYCARAKNKDGMLCAAVNANPVPGKDSQSGTGSGTGSGNGNGDGDGCTIKDCGSDTGGGPGKVGLPGTGAGEFGKLYEPKYPQGPVEVWKQSSAGIKNSGLGSLAMALMPKIADGGSAPVWIVDLNFRPVGDFGVHDISPPLWLWDVLKAITILTALITARRLIFGG